MSKEIIKDIHILMGNIQGNTRNQTHKMYEPTLVNISINPDESNINNILLS